jgi:antitoxin HicB
MNTKSNTRTKKSSQQTIQATMADGIFSYSVHFQSEPEGGYTVIVPTLPGCVTYGRTMKEAQAFALEAMSGYVESLRAHNEPIPVETSVAPKSMIMKVDARQYA